MVLALSFKAATSCDVTACHVTDIVVMRADLIEATVTARVRAILYRSVLFG